MVSRPPPTNPSFRFVSPAFRPFPFRPTAPRPSPVAYGSPSSSTLDLRFPRTASRADEVSGALAHMDEAIFRLTRAYHDTLGNYNALQKDFHVVLSELQDRDSLVLQLRTQIHHLQDAARAAHNHHTHIHVLQAQVKDLETRLATSDAAAATLRREADAVRAWHNDLERVFAVSPLIPSDDGGTSSSSSDATTPSQPAST